MTMKRLKTSVRDYIKYFKEILSGYSNDSFRYRNGRMTKNEAQELIQEYEGKTAVLEIFLEYLDMEESEFNDIVTTVVRL